MLVQPNHENGLHHMSSATSACWLIPIGALERSLDRLAGAWWACCVMRDVIGGEGERLKSNCQVSLPLFFEKEGGSRSISPQARRPSSYVGRDAVFRYIRTATAAVPQAAHVRRNSASLTVSARSLT